jgi:hypothetical protein
VTKAYLVSEELLRDIQRDMYDLRTARACDKIDKLLTKEPNEPVAWMQSNHLTTLEKRHSGSAMMLCRCSCQKAMDDFQPLYRKDTA